MTRRRAEGGRLARADGSDAVADHDRWIGRLQRRRAPFVAVLHARQDDVAAARQALAATRTARARGEIGAADLDRAERRLSDALSRAADARRQLDLVGGLDDQEGTQ